MDNVAVKSTLAGRLDNQQNIEMLENKTHRCVVAEWRQCSEVQKLSKISKNIHRQLQSITSLLTWSISERMTKEPVALLRSAEVSLASRLNATASSSASLSSLSPNVSSASTGTAVDGGWQLSKTWTPCVSSRSISALTAVTCTTSQSSWDACNTSFNTTHGSTFHEAVFVTYIKPRYNQQQELSKVIVASWLARYTVLH